MRAGARLALYGAGLAVAFGGAFALAGVVVPDSLVAAWAEGSDMDMHGEGGAEGAAMAAHGPNGVSIDADGYLLSPVTAPGAVGEAGELRFQVLDASGHPVTEYTTSHERELHTIVVRSDGAGFRHVHPALDAASGTWSLPWTWDEAGSYRLYADFTPAGDDAEGVTLTRTLDVAGELNPVTAEPTRRSEVDGFVVTIDGELTAGASSELTLTVERDGTPVTGLEPYLGAFGHLVALREGDLAFLHVHPEGEEPEAGSTGGPEIAFAASAPTPGRYLLYLDFQVDGAVHTAEFVIDASVGTAGEAH
ncbi:heavy-metal-associated domain-containing protein [Agromyces mediolanus]|uniref:heavy-metal-associated domain-containing protein n=1 Tax=Agromyces mediolanus TaxID=41986 RepID=UPI0020400A67|nr:heavy-metal-associated domain-containing protein [Agromyces mediolanus]MCM3658278.1 heavy-metal-associated domain-containing protein [Agromyces mediolanus]